MRDVPRSNVLTLRWIMRPPTANEDMTGPAVPVETIVRDAVPMVAADDRPLRAVADGEVVGVVDRVAVLNAFVPQEALRWRPRRAMRAVEIAPVRRRLRLGRPAIVVAIIALMVVVYPLLRNGSPWPTSLDVRLNARLDEVYNWIVDNQGSSWIYVYVPEPDLALARLAGHDR